MLNRVLAGSLAIALLAGCADHPTSPAAVETDLVTTTATLILDDGRAGPQAMSLMQITDSFCGGAYEEPYDGNAVVTSNGADVTVRVVQNRNFTIVSCRFTDESGVYEGNAETAVTDNCDATIDGELYEDGEGHLVAAANNTEEGADTFDGTDGGNVSMRCTFPAVS